MAQVEATLQANNEQLETFITDLQAQAQILGISIAEGSNRLHRPARDLPMFVPIPGTSVRRQTRTERTESWVTRIPTYLQRRFVRECDEVFRFPRGWSERRDVRREVLSHKHYSIMLQHIQTRIRCEDDYNFLMKQVEPLTQLGEEQEKLELAMREKLPDSSRGQNLGQRIRLRVWVAWVSDSEGSTLSGEVELENKLEQMSREMVQRDRNFLNRERRRLGGKDNNEAVDWNLNEDDIEAMREEQQGWAAFLDDLNISSQVAWDMQLSHGIMWADLEHDDVFHPMPFLDLVKPSAQLVFRRHDPLELPELWILHERPAANTRTGIAGKELFNHPPFLPERIFFDGMILCRTRELYDGYIEYRTTEQTEV